MITRKGEATYTLRIAGRDYTLTSTDAPEHVRRVAVYMDRKIAETASSGFLYSSGRLMTPFITPSIPELTRRTIEFVANMKDDATMPEKSVREVNFFGRCAVSDRHVIAIQVSRQTSYEAYFHLQNAIVAGYTQLRNQLARKHFHRPYTRCSAAERDAINMVYPQRISEDKPKTVEQEGGDA